MTVLRPALVVTVAAAAGRIQGSTTSSRDWLGGLWNDLSGLGMDEPISGVGTSAFPRSFPAQAAFRVLAARQGTNDPATGIRQTLLTQMHDTVVLTTVLGSAPEQTWETLSSQFAAATGAHDLSAPPPSVIGSASIRLGLLERIPGKTVRPHGRTSTRVRPLRIGDRPEVAIGSLIPLTDDRRWDADWYVTHQGFHLAEARDPAGVSVSHRVFAVLGESRLEEDLDRWSWSSARQTPPLIRYLVSAAKLFDQLRVYQDGQQFRALRHRTEQTLDELSAADIGGAELRWLLSARRTLAGQRSDTAGLITALTRIQAMTRTVEIADANMGAVLPPPADVESRRDCSVARDHQIAAWLSAQLQDDAVYLRAAADRAAYVETMVRDQISERQRGYAQQVTLIQTSVLGSIIMALTAISAFAYTVPVSKALRGPLVCLVAALALVLPGAAARWTRGVGDDAPWPGIDLVGVSLLGAATTWLGLSIVFLHHRTAPGILVTALASAIGAAICLAAGLWARR